jgi:MOSC domain-containing protein YiiM
MGTIRHIFIAPERGAPMIEMAEVEAVADCGLCGDRYSEAVHRESPDYQLTLIELEQIEAYTQATGLPMALHEPRRNLVTSGVDLNALNGKRFRVGEVELQGLDLCEPCGLFAQRTTHEALRFFVHRGGLRCRILSGGVVRRGAAIETLA